MNLIKISTKFILFIPFLIFISCSSPKNMQKITLGSFSNAYEISEGDSALVKWDFRNADSVNIIGIARAFNNYDSVYLSPRYDTTYNLIAVNSVDTQKIDLHIFVNHPKKEIQTGAEIIQKQFEEPSLETTDYLNGLLPSSVRFNLKNIKIIRSDLSDDSIILDLLPLDEFGNFINNLNLDSLNLSFEAVSLGMKMSFNQKLLNENHYDKANDSTSINILVEKSLAAYDLNKVSEQLRTAIKNFDNSDRVTLASFNQNMEILIDNESPHQAFLNFNPSNLIPSGTAAYSSAIIQLLQKIKNSSDYKNNIIILLSFSEENSSVTSTLDEALKIATIMKIPIYVITLSKDCKGYEMNSITDATGGRLYSLESNEFDNISKVISEIYFGQKVNYQFRLSFLNEIKNISELYIKVFVYSNQKFIEDNQKYYLEVPDIYIPYQILSLFDFASKEVPLSYYSKISELANLLKNNTSSVLEIFAFSYFEIDSVRDYELSLERAQGVREVLIDSGANPAQIRVKGRGNENPLYYLPTKEWQMSYNRRAEIRWLDPAFLPYEILAQKAVSESEALSKVQNWEKLGLRSYYLRSVINNDINYQVKIWGYATEKEAQNELKKLQERFPEIHFELE